MTGNAETFDLIVVGAGMAGITAANKASAAGWRTAIVDDLPYGGTCALRGCDPKKILRRAAEVVDSARMMSGKGVVPGTLAVDWAALMQHKRGFTDPQPRNLEQSLERHGVVTHHSAAGFTSTDSVELDGVTVRARHFLIATGARPRPLDFPGSRHVIDSTAFLELEHLPVRLLFVGGGLVSFEFAHIAARAGSVPLIIDHGSQPLKAFDPDLVNLLVKQGASDGIQVRTETSIRSVESSGTGYRVELEHAGARETIEVDLVIHGAGREADLDRLDLAAAQVASTRRGVTVAPHLQSTTNLAVYAAGDAADTGGMPLTPIAVIEGKVAASNMLTSTTTAPDYTAAPSVVFTLPELTRVGLLESEARERGIDVDVRFSDTSGWYSSYRIGASASAAKILVDRADDRIVGAHLLGSEYAEVINTIGLAMKFDITAHQLRSALTAYPTVGSDLASMV